MHIIYPYFILGVVSTILFLYFINPLPKIVLVSPSLNDAISPIYQDDKNVCYRYHRVEISKPLTPSNI
jgi:hypothetical protein